MNWSNLDEKASLKVLGLSFSSKLDWGSYNASVGKIASKKIGVLISSMKFPSSKVACYMI